MDEQRGTPPPEDRARTSSWGGPRARAELDRIADYARGLAGFQVCAIEVLRGDGLLELVAFAGPRVHEADVGGSFSLAHVRRVVDAGTRYGMFVFLPEEDMNPELQSAIRGYGYVPSIAGSTDPERWRALDMLVAPLSDASGRTRALLHLDEPVSGRRPSPAQLQQIAVGLELVLHSVTVTVDFEELTRRVRLDDVARDVVRLASQRLGAGDLLGRIHPRLMAAFHAKSLEVRLYDEPAGPRTARSSEADLSLDMAVAVDAAARRAWRSRTVIVAEPGHVWGDQNLDRHFRDAFTAHLAAHAATELVLVPVGAGHEAMGVLIALRDDPANRWTDSESHAALGVGHDVGRALLSSRAHEQEQRLIEELQRLGEYRRQLIDTVSHELKNPLGVILGHLELLGSVPGLATDAEPSLRAIGRSAARATAVVNDLLLLGSLGNRDDPVPRSPVDLAALLAEVCDDGSFRATQQDVTLSVELGTGALSVTGEPEELRRLLANLVDNAIKYSPHASTVNLSLEECMDEVVFTCADNGLGISEEDRRQLFTEFFRSTNPEALQRPGTGLGLAIVKRIVTRHGGHIDVTSELGVGTTIQVRMPAAQPKNKLAHGHGHSTQPTDIRASA